MSRRNSHKVIPLGCQDCLHAWVDRCGLTGHVAPYKTNAPYHCAEFKQEQRKEKPDEMKP